MAEQRLLDGKVILRPDDDDGFDELVAKRCAIHAEMMDDGTLWIGIDPAGIDRRVSMWITAEARGRLLVNVEED